MGVIITIVILYLIFTFALMLGFFENVQDQRWIYANKKHEILMKIFFPIFFPAVIGMILADKINENYKCIEKIEELENGEDIKITSNYIKSKKTKKINFKIDNINKIIKNNNK